MSKLLPEPLKPKLLGPLTRGQGREIKQALSHIENSADFMFNFFSETINTQLGVVLSGKYLQTPVMKQMKS